MNEVIKYLQEFADKLKENIPGFISVGILDFNGNVLVKSQITEDVFVELEAPLQLEVIKAAINSLEVSDLNKDNLVKDIIIETDEVTYFISVSEDRRVLAVVMLDSTKANIGLTRSFVINEKKKYAKQIAKFL